MWTLSNWLSGVCFLLLIYKLYKYCTYRPPNYPPGPPRLPIIGSYLFILLINHKYLYKAVTKLCEYYKTNVRIFRIFWFLNHAWKFHPQVLGFYFGEFCYVVANDQASIKEMLLKPEFDGRSDTIISRLRDPNFIYGGIFFIEGEFWTNQKRFSLRYLRDFGHGRRDPLYEMEVEDEIGKLIKIMKDGPKYEHEHVRIPY